jgi:hypothetical protein
MLAQVPAVSDEIIHPVSEEQVSSTLAKSGSAVHMFEETSFSDGPVSETGPRF